MNDTQLATLGMHAPLVRTPRGVFAGYKPPPYHPALHPIPEDREFDREDVIIANINLIWSLPEWMFPPRPRYTARQLQLLRAVQPIDNTRGAPKDKHIFNLQTLTTSLHVRVQVWKRLWSDRLAELFVLHFPATEPLRLWMMPDDLIQQHITELLHPRLELQCEFTVYQWDALALERRLQTFWASPWFVVMHTHDVLTWDWEFESA